ncbi:hypothetical protein DFH11DRAFT_1598589 [Phellopilus nigrolimitatus]|nr:hypothetical protein DFH11DRAFT_1598589 [Phellopilus nigrolimitatus]
MIAVCLHPLLVLVTVQLSFELVAECRWPSNQCTCFGLLSIQKKRQMLACRLDTSLRPSKSNAVAKPHSEEG